MHIAKDKRAMGAATLMIARIPGIMQQTYRCCIPKDIQAHQVAAFHYRATHGHKGRNR